MRGVWTGSTTCRDFGRKADVGSSVRRGHAACCTLFLAFLIVLGLIGATAWAVRRFGAGRLGGAGTRARQPRLAVVDHASVDSRRRLILVRRDNIEHLVLIGGPTDVVVEANIVRAAPATREATLTRPPPVAETLPRAPPLPENGNGSWPLRSSRWGRRGRHRVWSRTSRSIGRCRSMAKHHRGPRVRRWPRSPNRSQRGPSAIVSKAPHGNVQPNHEGSRAANHVPKLEQSRAGRRYNRIRRRLPADQNLAEMAHRLEAALRMPKMVADARGEGRAPPHVAPPANGVDAAAGEAASKPPR